jgi:hypothetical protein
MDTGKTEILEMTGKHGGSYNDNSILSLYTLVKSWVDNILIQMDKVKQRIDKRSSYESGKHGESMDG